MKIKISLKAYDDLEAIYHYTKKTWGVQQAEVYRIEFDNHFTLLFEYPDMGRQVEDQPKLRQFPMNKHIIFYRKTFDSIFIVRIRHSAEHPDSTL